MTAGLGLPAEWWTPPADAAMREGTPREALVSRVWSQDYIEARRAVRRP